MAGVVLVATGAFLTYRIVTQSNTTENLTPDSFLLTNYESLDFTDKRGVEHEGWLLRGLKGAPVVVLSHGFDSNRSEMLSVATVLQENHFNVYLFNYRGSKAKSFTSDLGEGETTVLADAVENLLKLPGVNTNRIGLYGKNVGAYATIQVAVQNPVVKAFVVDNVYDKPIDMFNTEIDQMLGSTKLFRVVMDVEFRLMHLGSKAVSVSEILPKLSSIPKYFISGRDTPQLANATEGFYDHAAQPKQLLLMDHTQPGLMNGTEKKEYENQILFFFLQNLPLRAD